MKKLVGLLLFLFVAQIGWADGIEEDEFVHRIGNLLSPGKLTSSHHYLETTSGCLKCHSLNKGVSDLLCLDCHREIKDRIDQNLGYHGLNKEKDCLSCHLDHKGEKKQIFDLDEVDHDQLKLHLSGAHQKVKCEKCHQKKFQSKEVANLSIDNRVKTKISFLGLDPSCESCHGKPHGKQFKKQICVDCHVDSSWKLTKFDHETQSDFKLRGKHTRVTCKACHKKDKKNKQNPKQIVFQGIDHQCSTCHRDTHKGRSGKECNSCHFPDRWNTPLKQKKIRGFNHNKTHFKLLGKHAKVTCDKCHKDRSQKDFRKRGFGQCTDCHKDPHRNQFAPRKCESCHKVQNSFKKGFNHDKTDFPLKKLHQDQRCEKCHKKGQFVLGTKKTCEGCHVDVRTVMQGRWLDADQAQVGPDPMFRTVDCASCHKQTDSQVEPKNIRKACVKCHNKYFGDLWDYREKKYGPEKDNITHEEMKKRLRNTHRFGDYLTEEQ